MTDRILERLRGYNPPDRTIDEQRHIAKDIHDALIEIERLRAKVERLLSALKESRRIVTDVLAAFGPCDHDVGICNCDMSRSIEQSDEAIAKATAQTDALAKAGKGWDSSTEE
jgi:hypothetical protein